MLNPPHLTKSAFRNKDVMINKFLARSKLIEYLGNRYSRLTRSNSCVKGVTILTFTLFSNTGTVSDRKLLDNLSSPSRHRI